MHECVGERKQKRERARDRLWGLVSMRSHSYTNTHAQRRQAKRGRCSDLETADSKLTKINWHTRDINPHDILIVIHRSLLHKCSNL